MPDIAIRFDRPPHPHRWTKPLLQPRWRPLWAAFGGCLAVLAALQVLLRLDVAFFP